MASFWRQLRPYITSFATNWSEFDAPMGTKARLLARSRLRSLGNRGCCGHHGEPGC